VRDATEIDGAAQNSRASKCGLIVTASAWRWFLAI